MIKELLNSVKVFLRHRTGYRDCPRCGEAAAVKWVKDTVVFEEEPPMFFHLECTNCGATSDVMPTILITEAIHSLGYESVGEYSRQLSETEEPVEWNNPRPHMDYD